MSTKTILRLSKVTGAGIFALILMACFDVGPANTNQMTGCQSCHQSPPTSGEHYYHLYSQTRRAEKITCIECHASSITKMLWKPEYIRNQTIVVMRGFQTWETNSDGWKMIYSNAHNIKESLCTHRVSGDSLYKANLDSLSGPLLTLTANDSLIIGPHQFKIITKANPSVFQVYHNCEYALQGDRLYQRIIGDKDVYVTQFGPKNKLIVDTLVDSLYYVIDNKDFKDTLQQQKIWPAGHFLWSLDSNQIKKIQTVFPDGKKDVFLSTKGTVHQVRGDTLYFINPDSSIVYGDQPFAIHGRRHGDGVVDVNFLHEKNTIYRDSIINIEKDRFTGDVLDQTVMSIGGWNPVKKSCYTPGVSEGQCHNSSERAETYWYTWKLPDFEKFESKEELESGITEDE